MAMTLTLSDVTRKAMGVLAFIHIFIVLVFATHNVGAASMEPANVPVTSSKCEKISCNQCIPLDTTLSNSLFHSGPYTATKAFIGRQTAFISNTLSFGTATSPRLKLQNLASVPLLCQVDTLRKLSLPFSVNSDMSVRRNRVRRCTKLHMATTEDAEAAPVKEKRIKKKTKDALEVVVIGLSHHNAKVDVREKLAIPEDQWNEAATVRRSPCLYAVKYPTSLVLF